MKYDYAARLMTNDGTVYVATRCGETSLEISMADTHELLDVIEYSQEAELFLSPENLQAVLAGWVYEMRRGLEVVELSLIQL